MLLKLSFPAALSILIFFFSFFFLFPIDTMKSSCLCYRDFGAPICELYDESEKEEANDKENVCTGYIDNWADLIIQGSIK